jgi:hypothetical protein
MKKAIVITILIFGSWHCFSQDFVNLNFENAIITPDPSSYIYPDAVYASNAIPGWTATGFLGPKDVLYDSASLGSTSVSILDADGFPPALDGEFSVYLYGGGTATAASISQTGIVPMSAESILFEAQNGGYPGGILVVSLGGQNLSYFALSNGPNYTLYGADISAFTGQREQLMFSALKGENFWNIDDIQFSTQSVPEPSAFALAALGTLLLGFRRWTKLSSLSNGNFIKWFSSNAFGGTNYSDTTL